jgi:integrase
MAITFSKLSRPNIRKLEAGQKISENGISFERLANGDGVYTVNIMVDRQRIHRTIGKESDGVTRTQAEQFIEQTRTAAREDRLTLPKGRKVALSFEAAAISYIERLQQEGGKNIDKKRRQLAQHLVPFFKSKPLSKIATFDISRFKKQREDQCAAPATINRELAVLSHLLNKGIEWGWINTKPGKITRFREDKGRITYLTPEQCARLLEEAKTDQSPHIFPFIIIGLSTAMRRMEILLIRREHVDLARRRIFIPEAKAGSRDQPITQELVTFLEGHIAALPKGTDWLFPQVGSRTGHVVDIRKAFRRSVERAGMDPDQVLRHTLRHTAITHLVQAGVDLTTVQKISGHRTLSMVARYAHANGNHIDAAMDKLEDRLTLAKSTQGGSISSEITPKLHKA